MTDSERLSAILARGRREGDCLLWTGHITNGSPQVVVDRKYRQVRRLLFTLAGESIPTGYSPVPTACRNPACIERTHIRLLTVSQIGQLAAAEGKFSTAERRRVIAEAKRKSPVAKLNPEKVADIRACKTGLEAAEKHGIHRSLAQRIRRGEAWRDEFTDLKPVVPVKVAPRRPGKYEVTGQFERAITDDWMLRRQGVAIPTRMPGYLQGER